MKVQLHNGDDSWNVECTFIRAYDGVSLFDGRIYDEVTAVSIPMKGKQARFELAGMRLVIEKAGER